MPDILAVNPTGLFSYGVHGTVSLDKQGIVQLTGLNLDRLTRDPNGAGKTSLLNASVHILFGKCPIKGATDTTVVNCILGRSWGMLKFNGKDGQQYRMVMSRKWKGEYPDKDAETEPCQLHEQGARLDGTDIYLDVWQNGKWIDQRCAKSAETRALAIKKFGMSYEQFLTNSYLAQQTGSLLVTGGNKERMQIITELTDMGIWDRSCARMRDKAKAKQAELDGLVGKLAGLQGALAAMPNPITKEVELQLYLDKSGLERKINDLNFQITEGQKALEIAKRDLIVHEDTLQAAGLEKVKTDNAIAQIYQTIAQMEGTRNTAIAKVQVDMATVEPIRATISALRADQRVYERQKSGLMAGGGRCERCGSNVTAEHLQIERNAINEKLTLLAADILAQERAEVAAAEKAREVARNLQTGIEQAWSVQIEAEKTKLSNLRSDQIRHEHVIRTVSEVIKNHRMAESFINQNIQGLTQQKHTAEIQCQQILTALDLEKQREANRTKLRDDIAAVQISIETAKQQLVAIQVCIKGMSDKGIKAHKFGTRIAQLNEILKEYINLLTDGQVQVWFSPFREKATAKNADDVAAEIQIMVREGPKEDIDIAMYSGAERQEATLAIICAFWRLAALQSGGTNILILDEIFGMLSRQRAEKAIALIDKLRESHFGTIVVVTHSDFVKDQLPHDQLWTAKKQNHTTTLVREQAA